MSADPRDLESGLEGGGAVRLALRSAVAMRWLDDRGRTLVYLSLFEDEIEPRLADFLAQAPASPWTVETLTRAALGLEPTDAVVLLDPAETLIARGGACSVPLYRATGPDGHRLSTQLPIAADPVLSLSGLAASMSVISVTYQNEPNFVLEAPLAGWSRLRRGAVTRIIADGAVSETPIDLQDLPDEGLSYEALTERLHHAFDAFGRRLPPGPLTAELSGGFDSSLAIMAARRHGHAVNGVSFHFPFYEFRYEEAIQAETARVLDAGRTVLEGMDFIAYTPPARTLRLDEPGTVAMALARDIEVARRAVEAGGRLILVGQGGDQLFSEDMLSPVPAAVALTPQAFNARGRARVEAARARMQAQPDWLRRSRLTYLHDARLDAAMKETVGALTRSPFSDMAVVRCGLAWARHSARRGVIEGKRILADAFEGDLPPSVAGRRSKVAWDGVCARLYHKNGDAIRAVLGASAPILEHIGYDARWLDRRVGQLQRWERTDFGLADREVFAAYGVATWLQAWGLSRVADAGWTD